MARDWQELTQMTQGSPLIIEKVRLSDKDIAIEGSFELPPLAELSAEDQIFVAAFIKYHGSIKEMERLYGVSYPTIKSRLNRIGEQLEFFDTSMPSSQDDVLSQLERGEITAEQALEMLKR